MKSNSALTKLFFALAFSCTSELGSMTSVLAQTLSFNLSPLPNSGSPKVATQNKSFNLPPVPLGPSPGGRARGGAKRSSNTEDCPVVQPELTALVPFAEESNKFSKTTNVWSLTLAERPTWLFYVPYTKTNRYRTEFVIRDDVINNNNDKNQENPEIHEYRQAIALPNKPGIISVTLPAHAFPLKLGKRYRWFFNITCQKTSQLSQESPPIYVEGVIQRVQLSQEVLQNIQKETPLKKYQIYAESGIWHEALITLAKLRQQYPKNRVIQTQWDNLLATYQFNDVAKATIFLEKPESKR